MALEQSFFTAVIFIKKILYRASGAQGAAKEVE
jgi:hypothetical protein